MKSQVWIGKKRLKKPLIQGGMGIGVSLSGLAGAVAKEGGSRNHFSRADRLFDSLNLNKPGFSKSEGNGGRTAKGEKDCTGWNPRV